MAYPGGFAKGCRDHHRTGRVCRGDRRRGHVEQGLGVAAGRHSFLEEIERIMSAHAVDGSEVPANWLECQLTKRERGGAENASTE